MPKLKKARLHGSCNSNIVLNTMLHYFSVAIILTNGNIYPSQMTHSYYTASTKKTQPNILPHQPYCIRKAITMTLIHSYKSTVATK